MSGLRATRPGWDDDPYAVDLRDECEAMRYCFKGGSPAPTTQQTVQSNDLPAYLKPFYISGLEASERDILNRPTEFFPGQTYADFAPETEAALGAQTARAVGGNPLTGAAQDYTGGVLAGDFLSPDSNPYFDQLGDAVRSQVEPAVSGEFGRAGRTGTSPLAAEATATGITRGLAPYLFGEYGRERGAQEAAANRAPGLAREDYYDIGQLGQVGGAREGLAQQGINEAISRYNFEQGEPASRTRSYMSTLQGVPVGFDTARTGTSQQGAADSNPWAGAAGGAMSGAAIGTSIMPGWGTAIGAAGGGLAGGLSSK